MKGTKSKTVDKVLSVLLALIMAFSTVPMVALAATDGTLTTDIDQKVFNVGQSTEFTFTTTANDFAGIMVIGSFEFSDPSAIEKLEYKESKDGQWYEFYGDFGPSTGFPMSDATSQFRVTFNKAGNFTVKASMKRVDNGQVLCSTTNNVYVVDSAPALSTDLLDKELVVGQTTEFTFTTKANDAMGINVIASFEFSDPSAIEKLEYKESKDGQWYEFYGDFGPSTGFPMSDATSQFRVTFNKAGNYTAVVNVKRVDTGTVLCSTGEFSLAVKDKYDVHVQSNEGGQVTLNGQLLPSVSVVENTSVNLNVQADKGYQIASVSIDGVLQELANKESFSTEILVSADVEVTVSFVKVFTIKVSCTGEGTVVTTPECEGGSVVVNSGTVVTVVATPNSNYRVSEVTINGVSDNTVQGNNDEVYNHEFSADQDYEFLVTFAPNRYNVTISSVSNGSVKVDSTIVNYGSSTVLRVTPDIGYSVGWVKINGVEISDLQDDGTYTIENITDNQLVEVNFITASVASMTDVIFNYSDALRSNATGNMFVFDKETNATFSTSKNAIKLTYSDGTTAGGIGVKEVSVDSSKTVNKIELRYKDDNEIIRSWHTVAAVTDTNPIIIVIDEALPTVSVEGEAANGNGFYSKDVNVTITATDPGDYSGLAKVEYWVVCDKVETQRDVLYTYESNGSIESSYTNNIVVNAALNNSDNVTVYARVTDRAGNESTSSCALKINVTKPIVSVSIDGSLANGAVEGYYNSAREAIITYQDRASSFDKVAALNGIVIQAVDVNGNPISVNKTAMISWNESGDIHQATIRFDTDAHYTWSVSYTNKADLSNDNVSNEVGSSIYDFTIDKLAPANRKITVDSETWYGDILSELTFGIWKNYSVTAEAAASDEISPMFDVLYYKSDSTMALNMDELDAIYAKGEFTKDKVTVNSDEKFIVYARFMDYAGNYAYISTDGIVYDKTVGVITLTPDAPNTNGYYSKNVNVEIVVSEDVNNVLAYSGIKSVSYEIKSDDVVTQSDTLYTFNMQNPKYEDLLAKWSGEIQVDAQKNNSDNVSVSVKVVDNAGNEYSNSIYLSINVDRPTAEIKFIDTPVKIDDGQGYYNAARVATLTVYDRAGTFDEGAATDGIDVKAVDVGGTDVPQPFSLGEWNHNGNEHSIDITFAKDGNYHWSFSYSNKADLALEDNALTTGDSATPFTFTVDTTCPTGTISVGTNTWDRLLNVLTFGLYSHVSVDIRATGDDATSPYILEYYKSNETRCLSKEELDAKEFTLFSDFSIETDEQFVIYLKVTDFSGNYAYFSSDGFIVDSAFKTENIILTPDKANDKNVYNGNVNVAIDIKDDEPSSGIQSIEYWVENNGIETQRATLYSFDFTRDSGSNTNGGKLVITDWDSEKQESTEPKTFEGAYPSSEQLTKAWNGSIVVDAQKNNSSNVVVFVKVSDNAGNEQIKSIPLDIDITAPSIAITYDNNKDNNGNSYFNKARTATIVISERANHFDETSATQGIVISAKDSKGNDVQNAYTISKWSFVQGSTPDDDAYIATIDYAADANYTFDISYTDAAGNMTGTHGNVNKLVDTKDSVAPFKFTVDTKVPFGSVTAKSAEGRESVWKTLAEDLTYGFWSKEKISLFGDFDDATSPIEKVEYYKITSKNASDNTDALTRADLDAITNWQEFTGLDVVANEQFAVYLKITDLAGNYDYISTDGLIVDDQAPVEETIAPEITIQPEQPINGLYNGNVKVNIAVYDPMVGGTYSGLKTVTYKVFNLGVETQSGTLYSFNIQNPKQEDLCQQWSGSITVDSKLNNSNDVDIVVYAEDNALNASQDDTSIKIDVTAPKIVVSYNNNDADSGKNFKETRTATIAITERNFRAEDVKISFTNTEGIMPVMSEWKKTPGTGNMDNTVWTATVVYSADGDYTFDISYADLADNSCTSVNYGDSIAPTAFTIDRTIPVVSVTYDNNHALNGNYYNASRTATIVIVEHNFSTDRVNIALSATDDGRSTTLPTVSKWNSNGDTHTATVVFANDALYSFDITYDDLAGNRAADYSKQTFYVDKTAPTLDITGVANYSANNGDVIPVVSYSDTNFDESQVSITLTGANRKAVALDGTYSDIHNGKIFTFKNFASEKEVDDIYTLTATLTDRAGNTSTKTVVFSVNRFGSTYVLSENTELLNGTYLQKAVDIVVSEINPNELKNIKITMFKNNETIVLTEGQDYRIDVSGGAGRWYTYIYTIFAKNFMDDGAYRLAFHSEDVAGNVAENTLDTKNTEVVFGIDATKPNIVVTNLESNVTYALENMTVNMSISDNLLLSKIVVYLDDYNTPYATWDAEEISDIITTNGDFSFDIAGDSRGAHKVKIVATDAAGNVQEIEVSNFYVTTDLLVRYYNNKPLFFGSIAGVIVLFGLIIFLVVRKRKKEDDQ